MGHLKQYREGWSYERFARYVIGKIAFIASPDTIGDDIGFDISGFFIREAPNRRNLMPDLPFLMQIKPLGMINKAGYLRRKRDQLYLDKHIAEYVAVKAPLYFGLVDKASSCIKVYSGQSIMALISAFGEQLLCEQVADGELHLEMRFVDQATLHPFFYESTQPDVLVVDLYYVATIGVETGVGSDCMKDWLADCSAYVRSIQSYHAGEFIYEGPHAMQFIGIGTFSHSIKRLMHASSMLSEVLRDHDNRFLIDVRDEDSDLIVTLGKVAEMLDGLTKRLLIPNELWSNVQPERWKSWYRNVTAIAESEKLQLKRIV